MNTVSPAFDSRAMPLAEPTTAPSAFSWWDWLNQWIGPRPRGGDVPMASQPQSPAAAPDDGGGQGSGRTG